jgi:hypothetical protein
MEWGWRLAKEAIELGKCFNHENRFSAAGLFRAMHIRSIYREIGLPGGQTHKPAGDDFLPEWHGGPYGGLYYPS